MVHLQWKDMVDTPLIKQPNLAAIMGQTDIECLPSVAPKDSALPAQDPCWEHLL